MRALWSDRPKCSHNASQKVKRTRRFSDCSQFGYHSSKGKVNKDSERVTLQRLGRCWAHRGRSQKSRHTIRLSGQIFWGNLPKSKTSRGWPLEAIRKVLLMGSTPCPFFPCFFVWISLVFSPFCFEDFLSLLFQRFYGFGRDKKSLVFWRFPRLFPKRQGKEGQGWAKFLEFR